MQDEVQDPPAPPSSPPTTSEPVEPDEPFRPAAPVRPEIAVDIDVVVVEPPPRFGRPGPPMRRSPLIIGFTAGLGLALAYTTYLAVQNVRSILVLIFIALFLAIGLNPAVVRLRKWGMPRGLAVAAVGIGAMLVLCGGVVALIPPLVQQSNALIENLPHYIDNLQRSDQLNRLNEQYQLLDQLKNVATPGNVTKALGGVWGGVQVAFSAVFNIVMVIVLTLYFMAAFDRLKEGGYRLVPASRRDRVRLLGDEILTKVGAYLGGALAIAVVAGLASFVFLLIIGVAYPYALAVLVAITDLIPQIGATLGAVVVSIVGFATSIQAGIACVVFFIIYQQIENYAIYPTVMRRAVKVTDLAAILSVLIGVAVLGIVGALVAIPVVAAVQLLIREVVIPRQNSR
ncbi:AI-2E family transporter [Dactylosporangium sp. NPDC051484]|uniref:AI-2E family transporter n=1 Tax=Dactylosporangium sp. NPDC051484 TaxID=3154942 RepID=UPI00344CCD12